LNAANEIAVEAFLARRIPFMAIPATIAATLDTAAAAGLQRAPASVDEVVKLDQAARALAAPIVSHFTDTTG
jgi:1-deoxy-D-xylulose-5-phosphate reductoisomerase